MSLQDSTAAAVEFSGGWEGLQGAEVELLCYQPPAEPQGLVRVWIVVRTWAGIAASAGPGAAAAGSACHGEVCP